MRNNWRTLTNEEGTMTSEWGKITNKEWKNDKQRGEQ